MMTRVWRGWTRPEMADRYEALLRTNVFPGICAKGIPGFRRIELYRRPAPNRDETEFMTVMWFDDERALAAFAGTAGTAAYVPDAAREVLAHFDDHAAHYDLRETQPGTSAPLGMAG